MLPALIRFGGEPEVDHDTGTILYRFPALQASGVTSVSRLGCVRVCWRGLHLAQCSGLLYAFAPGTGCPADWIRGGVRREQSQRGEWAAHAPLVPGECVCVWDFASAPRRGRSPTTGVWRRSRLFTAGVGAGARAGGEAAGRRRRRVRAGQRGAGAELGAHRRLPRQREWRLPGLQRTTPVVATAAGREPARGPPSPARTRDASPRTHALPVLAPQVFGVVGLGLFNLVGVVTLASMLRDPYALYALREWGLGWVGSLLPALAAYAAAFFAVPAARALFNAWRNAAVEARNGARRQAARLLQEAAPGGAVRRVSGVLWRGGWGVHGSEVARAPGLGWGGAARIGQCVVDHRREALCGG